MRSKLLQCVLILLLMWGWIDDLVISTANADPRDDVATSENDDYIPSTSVETQDPSFRGCPQVSAPFPRQFVRTTSVALGLNRNPAPALDLLSPIDSLYALMSLQR